MTVNYRELWDGWQKELTDGTGGVHLALGKDDARCIAEGKTGHQKRGAVETHRCQKEAGHDGAHEVKYELRTVSWYGPAVKQEDDTRFRWGLR